MTPSPLALLIALAVPWAAQVHAQGASTPTPTPTLTPLTVTARGNTDPVEKSYVKMIRGIDLFEQSRATLAPGAQLR